MNYFFPKDHFDAVLWALFLANLMSVTTAWAVDFGVTGDITPGIMRYTYQEDFKASDDVKWQDNVPFLGAGVGLTASSVNLSFLKSVDVLVDLSSQWADIGDDREFRDTLVGNTPAIADWNVDFKRQDYVLTLGATKTFGYVLAGASIGYKGSKAELNGTHRFHPLGSPARIYPEDSTTLKTNGMFGGITIAGVYKNFAMTLNLAYSWLNSEYDSKLNSIHEEGDNEGLTYGLKFRYKLPNYPVSLTLSGDYYSYETGFPIREKGTQLNSVKEKMIPLRFSITYRFK